MKSQKPKENGHSKAILKSSRLPILEDDNNPCSLYGYDVESLMRNVSIEKYNY
ncbi:hypothetical protein BH23THE1_BH23THE1_23350 [soil metagenome]